MKKNRNSTAALSKLGQEFHLATDVYREIEQFACSLCGCRKLCSVNDVRYAMFCGKKGAIESHNLPPCSNSLRLHVERANYQAAIWRRSLIAKQDIPNPNWFGWTVKADGSVRITWMSCEPAPEAILELMACCCS